MSQVVSSQVGHQRMQRRRGSHLRHRQDFYGPAPLPAPTDMPPASWGKVLVLAERARRCESLFHPDDAPMRPGLAADLKDGRLHRRRSCGEDETRRRQAASAAFRAAEAARKRAVRQRAALARQSA